VGVEFFKIDTEGARVSKDFLTQLVQNIARRATEYYNSTGILGDHIFSYREKQFHSVVCPSIADITSSFVIEHPLRRKPYGEKEFSGHADYWIRYHSYCFLMELKHTFFSIRRPNSPRPDIAEKFDDAVQQLKSVKIEQSRQLILNEGLVKIALEAIAFYKGSSSKQDLKSVPDLDFQELFSELIEKIRTNEDVHMYALWTLNDTIIKPYEYDSHTFEVYPALGFIANISDKIE
jgi:hypothetical protein